MFFQIFFSLQVKGSVILRNKHGIYELRHELPNDLRLIKEYQENLKISKIYSLVPSLRPKMKVLPILAKNSLKIEIELFP